jgi:hypothetical protein
VADTEVAYWDDAYTNGAYIPGGDTYRAKWAANAEAFRSEMSRNGRAELDQAYGPHPRERFDLSSCPSGRHRASCLSMAAIDGIRQIERSHLAAGALARGCRRIAELHLVPRDAISTRRRSAAVATTPRARRPWIAGHPPAATWCRASTAPTFPARPGASALCIRSDQRPARSAAISEDHHEPDPCA